METLSKVPAATLGFWVIKIIATTLGETGGDALSMSMGLGYLTSTFIFAAILIVAAGAQIRARRFHPWLYWFVIVATTTAGTTLADFLDRSLGIGYPGGVSILLVLVLGTLAIWRLTLGRIQSDQISGGPPEIFYWVTIMFSQTLGTALGDWMADTNGFGYERGALVFAAGLAVVALLYATTKISRAVLFWAAFILTRPLGATLGDLLDKPISHGGFALDRFTASAVLVLIIVACVAFIPQRAGRHPA